MTGRQAIALVIVAIVAVSSIALIWSLVGGSCYDPRAPCDLVTPVEWVFAGLIGVAAIGFGVAILSRSEWH